jgi:hypothetical protein
MALSDNVKEGLYVFNFVKEMFRVTMPMALKYDNQGSGYLAQNEVNNNRSKHIDVRYHFIRDMVSKGRIRLDYVHTSTNLADALTKALPRPAQDKFKPAIMGRGPRS